MIVNPLENLTVLRDVSRFLFMISSFSFEVRLRLNLYHNPQQRRILAPEWRKKMKKKLLLTLGIITALSFAGSRGTVFAKAADTQVTASAENEAVDASTGATEQKRSKTSNADDSVSQEEKAAEISKANTEAVVSSDTEKPVLTEGAETSKKTKPAKNSEVSDSELKERKDKKQMGSFKSKRNSRKHSSDKIQEKTSEDASSKSRNSQATEQDLANSN